jgi:hypothetical protein
MCCYCVANVLQVAALRKNNDLKDKNFAKKMFG